MNQNDSALVRGYLSNAIRSAFENDKRAIALADWICRYDDDLEEDGVADLRAMCEAHKESADRETEPKDESSPSLWRPSGPDAPLGEAARARYLLSRADAALRESLGGVSGDDHFRNSPTARAASLFASRLDLGPVAAAVVHLGHLYAEWGAVERLYDHLHETRKDLAATTAALLGVRKREVTDAMLALLEFGFGDRSYWYSDRGLGQFASDIEAIWQPPVRTDAELLERLVGRPSKPSLDLDDFRHLDARDDAVRLLSGALRQSTPGVNILLHGRAGTGKTEFAKTLAAAAGGRLYSTGEPEADGETRGNHPGLDRRNDLRRADRLLGTEGDAVLLCDELDEVFDAGEKGSRVSRLRLLEDNRTPTIYTANRIGDLDEAVLRRFMLIARFTALSPGRRTEMNRRILAGANLPKIADPETLAARLSDELEAAPGVLAQAIRVTELTGGGDDELFRHAERIERAISRNRARPRLGPPVEAKHPWSAFAHLGKHARDVRDSLAAAVFGGADGAGAGAPAERRTGVNLLFYGPPGTGKTEFARTLCAEIGARLYSVGEKEFGPDARAASDRWDSLEYALEALADEPGTVLLFDEMEDLPGLMPKQWLNGLLEANPVPVLWAANATDYYREFEPFFLDRMLHALEFRTVPAVRRKGIYDRILSRRGLAEEASAQLAGEFARMPDVTPRQVTLASSWAAVRDGDADGIRRNLARKRRLRRGAAPAAPSSPSRYDAELLCADCDLVELADRIVACGPRRMGLLFSGPPGAGKTAFVRHLAERWERETLSRRASDLLGRYVGDNERNLARAFEEARDLDAVLVLDEADSLLIDRRGAERHWQVGLVNELLSQMESHTLPFACTTNLSDALDPASLRRFLFRAKFRFLDGPRIARAFRLFFDAEASPEVRGLPGLTPADFALVRERAAVLDFLTDTARITEELRRESGAKESRSPRAVGFAPVGDGKDADRSAAPRCVVANSSPDRGAAR